MVVYDQFWSKFIIKPPIESVWNPKLGKKENFENPKIGLFWGLTFRWSPLMRQRISSPIAISRAPLRLAREKLTLEPESSRLVNVQSPYCTGGQVLEKILLTLRVHGEKRVTKTEPPVSTEGRL